MKKLLYLIIVIGVALAGFALGRASGLGGAVEEIPLANHEYPLPPPPPDSVPYFSDSTDESGASIVLESPVEDAKILGSFEVSGRARADKGKVSVTLSGTNGGPLYGRLVSVVADAGDEYGRFSTKVSALDYVGEVLLEVGFSSGGDDEERVSRNLELVSKDTVEVEIFFTNFDLDPWQSCQNVFAVKRHISSETNIYRAAIEALIEGPTDDESADGYESSLPERVRLKSVAADSEGVVTADFDDYLGRGVAGSCRVGAIRAQIESTLKQFPEVREVVISIDGETEEILQP